MVGGEGVEVAELRQVPQVALQVGGLVGVQPVEPLLRRILQQRRQPAPGEEVLGGRLGGARLRAQDFVPTGAAGRRRQLGKSTTKESSCMVFRL